MNDTDATPAAADAADPTVADASAIPTRRRRRGRIVAGVAAVSLVAGAFTTVAVSSAVAAEPVAAVAADTPDRSAIPPELREDIRALIQADPDDRPALFRQILERAEDGDYGTRAQVVAERIDERLEALPAELKADLAEVRAAPAEDRPELRQQMREKAESGEYGPHVQARFADLQQAYDDGGIRALIAELRHGAQR